MKRFRRVYEVVRLCSMSWIRRKGEVRDLAQPVGRLASEIETSRAPERAGKVESNGAQYQECFEMPQRDRRGMLREVTGREVEEVMRTYARMWESGRRCMRSERVMRALYYFLEV
jgi:hypothetical protein